MKVGLGLPLCLMVHIWGIIAVDKGNFKTCDQSSFCRRHRNVASDESPYVVSPSSIDVQSTSIHLQLLNTQNNIPLQLDLFGLQQNMLRLKVNEINPLRPRFEIPAGDIIIEEPKADKIDVVERDGAQIVLQFNDSKIVIHFTPFRIDVLVKGEPAISVNGRGLLMFEHLRLKKQQQSENKDEEQKENKEGEEGEGEESEKKEEDKKPDNQEADDNIEGMWEESFKSHHDSKPFGPSSIGMDFSFPGYEFVYGIPEHADSLALKSTKGTDPFRLYNLDVFEYELNNPMALYGSVPVMLAHNEKRTLGLFWYNAAETWVDISSNIADRNMFSKLVDFVKGDNDIPQIDTHWFAESGIIDVFMMLGPKPTDVFKQYAKLTGTTPLPPLFALGYHQSRWNYNDEQDVASVNAGFDEHDIPLDVIWLDIEHTDGKRYFTWDHMKFPAPEEMIRNLTDKGRKMVTIIDPHIKRDDGYHIYREGRDLGYFVKTKDGSDYEGWCWPGSSVWFDFLDPKIRKFWASKMSLSEYKGSTPDLFTWNDMNEPAVFNGPEITMYKDAKHYGGWEHRDVHNLFGLYVHQSTIEGQLLRSENHRPFVLSRAFFAGSQRFGAVWTGDNTGDWGHLKISIPMVVSLNLVGLTFSGADVGGFFKNPDAELLARWYQAATFQPFFRAHAHLDTRRREPWLYSSEHTKAIRHAIRLRYFLMPYWYTLFFNAEREGGPVAKALWVEFPEEKATFNIDDEHLIGSAILVHPVTDMGSTGVNVFLPGPDQLWYDMDTYQMHTGGKNLYQAVDLQKIPVYLRGGFIIPLHERVRRAVSLSAYDPYTLLIVLDRKGQAKGDLYHDDFHSFNYRSGQYIHRQFVFADNKLTSRNLNEVHQFPTDVWIERIQILGISSHLENIQLTAPGFVVALESTYDADKKLLTIRKPGIKITSDFEIRLK